MSDDDTPISALKAEVRRFNQDRDWEQYHSPRNLVMALSVEVSELMELFLWCRDEGPQPPVAARQAQVVEELGDVGILLLNLADRLGVDLAEAIQAKIAYNAEKYPVALSRGRLEKAGELRAAAGTTVSGETAAPGETDQGG